MFGHSGASSIKWSMGPPLSRRTICTRKCESFPMTRGRFSILIFQYQSFLLTSLRVASRRRTRRTRYRFPHASSRQCKGVLKETQRKEPRSPSYWQRSGSIRLPLLVSPCGMRLHPTDSRAQKHLVEILFSKKTRPSSTSIILYSYSITLPTCITNRGSLRISLFKMTAIIKHSWIRLLM